MAGLECLGQGGVGLVAIGNMLELPVEIQHMFEWPAPDYLSQLHSYQEEGIVYEVPREYECSE